MDSTTAQHNGKDDIQETQEVIEEIQDFLDQFMDDTIDQNAEDSDWLPDNEVAQHQPKGHNDRQKKKPGRQLQDRTKSLTSSARSSNGRVNKIKTIQDRKERKKMQNVEAARRYRDKKKAEES